MTKKEAERLWKSGKKATVERTKPQFSKVTINIQNDLFDELVTTTTETGKKLSEVINEILREFFQNLQKEKKDGT